MAHRVLINGTGYDVSGGRELINGTSYSKKKGRVLVNGTGYDILFSIPLTIEGGQISASAGSGQGLGYVEYNGTKYTDETLNVKPGEQVRIYLRASASMFYNSLKLTVYGETIAGTKVSATEKEYYLTVTKASKIEFISGTAFKATVTEV